MKAADYRQIMSIRFQVWQEVAASIGCKTLAQSAKVGGTCLGSTCFNLS
jgi:hypothetical protein